VLRVVHPHDPLAPGEIGDVVGQRDRRELPIQNGHRSERSGVEQEVLRTEVPVTDTGTVDVEQDGAARGQHRFGMSGGDEVLAVPAGDVPQRQRLPRAVEHRRHRDAAADEVQSAILPVEAGGGVRTGVRLHDHRTIPDRLVGVAVRQPLHPATVTSTQQHAYTSTRHAQSVHSRGW
jgi:hypothetical protein